MMPRSENQKNEKKVVRRTFQNFSNEKFREDISRVPWDDVINNNDNVNLSLNKFIKKFENILDKHAPFKNLTKKEIFNLNRTWVTKGLSKAITTKNKIHKKFLKAKDPTLKNRLHNEFKRRRNIISNLLKKSKQNHYTKFFDNNLDNLKNTWKGIKE